MNRRARWVIEYCAAKHGVTFEQICNKKLRPDRVARARHEAMWIMRKVLRRRAVNRRSYSYPAIGQIFGGMDHSTVIHGVRRHAERAGL